MSVIIATNRITGFLAETLDSVEQQSYPNWELIVVDDGSPTPDELRLAVESRRNARVIRQVNAGVCIARNVGLAASRGEFCAFLDDDDVWPADRLALQVSALQSEPGAVLAYGRVMSIDEEGREISPADQRRARNLRAVFDGTATPQGQTLLMRREHVVRVGGFNSALVHSEDLDLILRLARDGSFVFVDAVLSRYRAHASNNSSASRYLASSIDAVIRMQLVRAREERDGTARALRVRSRANGRFAFWSAARASRGRGARIGAANLLWAFRFAPLAPADAVIRRLLHRRG